jgi:hypothetical protein
LLRFLPFIEGVDIETPEERKRAQVAHVIRQADNINNTVEDEISFVLVPADTSKPLEELRFEPSIFQFKNPPADSNDSTTPQRRGGDFLLQFLKPYFARKSGENVDIELLKKHSTSTTLASSSFLPNGGTVSDTTLQKVSDEAHIEVFSLVKPMSSNNFTGINLYLDEGTSISAFATYATLFLGGKKLK